MRDVVLILLLIVNVIFLVQEPKRWWNAIAVGWVSAFLIIKYV